ncbi:MAG: TRAM domain-containing protein, partial [Bacillota bacterium]|nr:TRAM domain-containing protein [Bacillota bacterium]
IHVRTTVLVGFPGETEEDLQELIDFIDEMKIDRLGAFAFSDEEGTPSYELDGKLPLDIKEARRDLVMEHQCNVSEELNERKIGRVFDVIIDEIEPDGYYVGRTRFDAPEIDCEVSFKSDKEHELGEIVKVRIDNTYEYDLEGEEV